MTLLYLVSKLAVATPLPAVGKDELNLGPEPTKYKVDSIIFCDPVLPMHMHRPLL